MNRLLALLSLICLSSLPFSTRAESDNVRLTGIINLPEFKTALLDYTARGSRWSEHLTMNEGERSSDIEVIKIEPEAGRVKLKVNQDNLSVTLDPDKSSNAPAARQSPFPFGVYLTSVNIDQLILLYGRLTDRTVLRPQLDTSPITLTASAANKVEAAAALAKAFVEKGLTIIPDGAKFVMIVPTNKVSMAIPSSSKLISTPGNAHRGEINFPKVNLAMAAPIYAELRGMKLDQATPFPPFLQPISLRSQGPLTKEEAIYALDTLFSWQNIKFVPVGNNLLQTVQITPQEK